MLSKLAILTKLACSSDICLGTSKIIFSHPFYFFFEDFPRISFSSFLLRKLFEITNPFTIVFHFSAPPIFWTINVIMRCSYHKPFTKYKPFLFSSNCRHTRMFSSPIKCSRMISGVKMPPAAARPSHITPPLRNRPPSWDHCGKIRGQGLGVPDRRTGEGLPKHSNG